MSKKGKKTKTLEIEVWDIDKIRMGTLVRVTEGTHEGKVKYTGIVEKVDGHLLHVNVLVKGTWKFMTHTVMAGNDVKVKVLHDTLPFDPSFMEK